MAPKMEVRDKTFTAARRQGGKAAQAESVAAKGSGIHWSLGHTSCKEPCGVHENHENPDWN